MHIANEHRSIRCETRRKIPPFATEFCHSKKPASPAGIPVSGNSGVLQNGHVPRLSDRRAGVTGGAGTESGQAVPAAMWVFCSPADTVGEFPGRRTRATRPIPRWPSLAKSAAPQRGINRGLPIRQQYPLLLRPQPRLRFSGTDFARILRYQPLIPRWQTSAICQLVGSRF